jgi:hypothetical protein
MNKQLLTHKDHGEKKRGVASCSYNKMQQMRCVLSVKNYFLINLQWPKLRSQISKIA